MNIQQREQNPDVNSRNPDIGADENPATENSDSGVDNIESGRQEPVIPVPPDVGPTAPIEDPAPGDEVPVGDVDDSPKRIM